MPHLIAKSHSRGTAYAGVLAVLLFLYPTTVSAIPISEYQQNIKTAITSLESLREMYSDENRDNADIQWEEPIENIRVLLPRNETIEAEGEFYNVDNSWLHAALDQLKEPAQRREGLEQILASLRAVSGRIDERQQASPNLESKEAAQKRLQDILARPEYVTTAQGTNALTRLFRTLIEWLRKLFPEPQPMQPDSMQWLVFITRILAFLSAIGLLVFIVRLVWKRFKRTKKIKTRKRVEPRIVLGERLEPEQTAGDLLSDAEALARSGDLRAAIRKAYIALLVELGDRKVISLAQHKTNRDYLNALRDLPPLHSRMRGLTDSFERHWYGFAEATQSDWQNFRDGYLAALQRGH